MLVHRSPKSALSCAAQLVDFTILPAKLGDRTAARAIPMSPRGFPDPSLLAMILVTKLGQHQPLNSASAMPARGST
jgi:hypothetical protein